MLTDRYYEDSKQLLLDLRPRAWVQLELDLEYLPQPPRNTIQTETPEITSSDFLYANDTIASTNLISSRPFTAHINTAGSEPVRSRLIVSPELMIDLPRKAPNALVRFFHKHLLNFTWETL